MVGKYKKPPVKEAIFEIRFPAELSIECRKDEYYEKIRKELPQIFVPAIDSPEPYPLKNYKFQSPDNSKMVMFSINRFSYHDNKYSNFDNFRKETEKYVIMFCDLYKISQLKRTGLRYINHIPITQEKGTISIKKYLKFEYNLPKSIPTDFELFQTLLLTKLNDGKLRILIQTVQTKENQEIILLDFDFFFEGKFFVTNLGEYLEKSHKHTKKVFEDLISDEYKKFIIQREE